jgi:ATP-dependent Zn protease
MKKSWDEAERVAYDEAGHAIASIFSSIRPKLATIIKEGYRLRDRDSVADDTDASSCFP